jgi:antitoxin PrlF
MQSTLTSNWQTTIPAEIRKALNLKPRQKITYELTDDGAVLMKPQPNILTDLYGSLSSDVPAGTKEAERKSARNSRVERLTV